MVKIKTEMQFMQLFLEEGGDVTILQQSVVVNEQKPITLQDKPGC